MFLGLFFLVTETEIIFLKEIFHSHNPFFFLISIGKKHRILFFFSKFSSKTHFTVIHFSFYDSDLVLSVHVKWHGLYLSTLNEKKSTQIFKQGPHSWIQIFYIVSRTIQEQNFINQLGGIWTYCSLFKAMTFGQLSTLMIIPRMLLYANGLFCRLGCKVSAVHSR